MRKKKKEKKETAPKRHPSVNLIIAPMFFKNKYTITKQQKHLEKKEKKKEKNIEISLLGL